MHENDKIKRYLFKVYLPLIAGGVLTGVLSGVLVSLYNLASKNLEKISAYVYDAGKISLLVLFAIALGVLLLAAAVTLISKKNPMIRGSGIPQSEGLARGLLSFSSVKTFVAMFFASLMAMLAGLTAGSEGPSVQLGACVGDSGSKLFKKKKFVRRYMVTGGMAAGLATAFNAPFSGIVFALEEAQKRITPNLLLAGFSAVIPAVAIRRFILGSESALGFFEVHALPPSMTLYALAVGLAVGILGAFFNSGIFFVKKTLSKLKHKKYLLFLPFILGAAAAFFLPVQAGGGHLLMEEISLFQMGFWVLFAVLLVKTTLSVLNLGSGIPGGIFVPMLAIGACMGAILVRFFSIFSLEESYRSTIVVLCMAGFFTAVTRTPITAVLLTVELTGSFEGTYGVLIAVGTAYLTSQLTGTEPLYEKLLDGILEENGRVKSEKLYTKVVQKDSYADRMRIRDILWPSGVRLLTLRRRGELYPAEGGEMLLENDVLEISDTTGGGQDRVSELVGLQQRHGKNNTPQH